MYIMNTAKSITIPRAIYKSFILVNYRGKNPIYDTHNIPDPLF